MELKEKIFSKLSDKNFYIRSVSILLGLILLVMLMDWIVMPLYTKHGRDFELPDVTDSLLDEAVVILKENGFNPIIQDSIYDEHFSPGKVIQQNPSPFSRVKKGRRIYLIISIGERPRQVPMLIGLTPQDAEFRLKEAGLKLNEKIVDFSDFYPRGVVINQSITAGEIVEKDQLINITVSLGPAPSSLEVPNLVGKSLESAKKELDVVGLVVGKVRTVYRPNLVPGTILLQSVPPGQKVALIDSVSLIISTDQPIGNE